MALARASIVASCTCCDVGRGATLLWTGRAGVRPWAGERDESGPAKHRRLPATSGIPGTVTKLLSTGVPPVRGGSRRRRVGSASTLEGADRRWCSRGPRAAAMTASMSGPVGWRTVPDARHGPCTPEVLSVVERVEGRPNRLSRARSAMVAAARGVRACGSKASRPSDAVAIQDVGRREDRGATPPALERAKRFGNRIRFVAIGRKTHDRSRDGGHREQRARKPSRRRPREWAATPPARTAPVASWTFSSSMAPRTRWAERDGPNCSMSRRCCSLKALGGSVA